MTPQRLQQIEEVYHSARDREPGERGAFLAEACRGDPELCREVELLLAQNDREGVMERPAMAAAASLLKSETVARLAAGAQLGPYQILAPIGKGGMGEVYRARDSRLGRDVAVKVSAERFNSRFEREARAIAALNHPHICTLYDVGPNYLVMELVEGDTLAALLKKGALAMSQVLRYGTEIADALSAAHAKCITHRDLKPGNIMITRNGVKVLDFGLAKSATDETMTFGIMGTPAYMAPEQKEGKPCDARTDIYALGLILAEMATGTKGSPEHLTGHFGHVVKRCLETDPAARWQTASDIKAELEWTAKSLGATHETGTRKHRGIFSAAIIGAAVLGAAVVGLAIRAPWRATPVPSMVRFEIPVPKEAFNPGALAVSPDGHYITFAARDPNGGPRRLWLRAVDSMEARVLPGTEGAGFPFWSPDSRFIGVFVPGKLMKVEIAGGPPQTVCDCNGTGGSWSRNGVVLYYDGAGHPMRVPAGGGVPSAISDVVMRVPYFLSDGRHFLYQGGPGNDRIYVGSLDDQTSSPRRELAITPFAPIYAPSANTGSGYLLFLREGTLLAQPFDERRMETAGDPVPVAQHIQSFARAGFFGTSANNVLVYRVSATVQDTQLTWFDRQGKSLNSVGEPASHLSLALSPDGSRAAFGRVESATNLNSHLWVLDLARGTTTRFTSGPGSVNAAVWSPDANSIVFSLSRDGRDMLYRKPALGGNEELLLTSNRAVPTSWSPDGRFLLYRGFTAETSIWALPLEGDRKPAAYLVREFGHEQGRFSPNGRWVAYVSNESGRNEIYVREFSPSASAAAGWLVSKGGGEEPHWGADGKELLYLGGRNLMSVDVTTGPTFRAGEPRPLFQLSLGTDVWDVTTDGKRFLVAVPLAQNAPPPFTVMLNWQSMLKK